MGRLTVTIATAATAALLAIPAAVAGPAPVSEVEDLLSAQPTTASNRTFVQLSAPKHKGYRWGVLAFKQTPRSETVVAIFFSRRTAQGTQFQTSEFSWDLPRGALRAPEDLKPVSLGTGKGMGNNGSIDMRLTRSEGHLRIPAEEGCTGHISFRSGRFGGRFRFNARDQHFKRISMQGAPAFVYREHDYRCSGDPPPPPCPEDLTLTAEDPESGLTVAATKTPEGKVDQTVVATRELDTGRAIHAISVGLAVPEAFDASEDLTSANVDGDAAGPWISGDLSYVGTPASDSEDEQCGPYRSSSGIATGDYTAHFDSIGDVAPAPTGVSATLRRES